MTNTSEATKTDSLVPEFSAAEQTRDHGLTFPQLAVLLVDCGKCLAPTGEQCSNGGAHANRIRRLKCLRRGAALKPIRAS